MSSPELLLDVLRTELRRVGMTYKQLANLIDMSESSIKRMFGQKDMTLSRLAQICKVAEISLEDVLRQAADVTPQADHLTLAQEKALMENPKLLLVAISCLGHWTFEQIIETYTLTEAECVLCMIELDKHELIELKPMNRYRLRVSPAFRWRADGPIQAFFKEKVVADYFEGRFDGTGESLMCVPARLSQNSAREIQQKIQHLAAEIARLQQEDRRLPPEDRDGFTLMLGFRSWEFSAFTALRRPSTMANAKTTVVHQIGPKNK
ncbi:helix-turn-helix transcriptional regulator [Undibacterium cyanobacteriorum]|uniref:Helix-turn-helix transcriptional regulator n=1 Tax=Undibacterium cyanobacteriorum TaxID=3073561 RepID=A0ABY9RLE8_9BURK|nr:helix-turn-helix transcriptional regulator [Undibacterium sp. 20NA77.5]WMW81781.1 helix-turn-helix transcriptional regulator [Undibacterium sp. 20NA77.5]